MFYFIKKFIFYILMVLFFPNFMKTIEDYKTFKIYYRLFRDNQTYFKNFNFFYFNILFIIIIPCENSFSLSCSIIILLRKNCVRIFTQKFIVYGYITAMLSKTWTIIRFMMDTFTTLIIKFCWFNPINIS